MSHAPKVKLPKEAIKFAKSMGLDLDGLEPEAEDIWKMLDAMSNSNPVQYEEFIAEQMRNAKEEEDGKKVDPDKEKRSFRPVGDGLKIRDIGASEGKKFFINICSSVVIEEPTDKNGNPIIGDRSVADGLSIPLIVGPVRGSGTSLQSTEKDLFVDVVLNPKVLDMAAKEQYFRAQIVDLALDWVIKESGVDCKKSWEFVPESVAKYKGGRGDANDIPVLFFVDSTGAPVGNPDIGSKESKQRPAASKVMSSTASLLSQLNKEKQGEQESVQENINIFQAASGSTSKQKTQPDKKANNSNNQEASSEVKKKPLIQEIGVTPSAPAATTSPPVQPPAPAPALSQGPAAKSPPVVVPVPAPTASAETTATTKMNPYRKEPTKMEYLGMEKLLSSFDEEFSTSTVGQSDRTFMDAMEADSMISNLAKVLSGETSGISSEKPSYSKPASSTPTTTAAAASSKLLSPQQFQIRNDSPGVVNVNVTTENSGADESGGVFTLTISGLSHATDASSMELLVSPTEALVLINKTCLDIPSTSTAAEVKVGFGARCNNAFYVLQESSASASLKKKKGTLIVKVSYSSK